MGEDKEPTFYQSRVGEASLDVAVVAKAWLALSPSLLHKFCLQAGLSASQAQAWALFFVALHDIKDYWHGPAGVHWLYQDWLDRFGEESNDDDFLCLEEDNESWLAWLSWLAAGGISAN